MLRSAGGDPGGIYAATKRGTVWDTLTVGVSLFGQSRPNLWLGIVLIMVFAVWLRILPTSGYGSWRHMVLPTITPGSLYDGIDHAHDPIVDARGTQRRLSTYGPRQGVPERVALLRHAPAKCPDPGCRSSVSKRDASGRSGDHGDCSAWPGIGSLAVDSITTLGLSGRAGCGERRKAEAGLRILRFKPDQLFDMFTEFGDVSPDQRTCCRQAVIFHIFRFEFLQCRKDRREPVHLSSLERRRCITDKIGRIACLRHCEIFPLNEGLIGLNHLVNTCQHATRGKIRRVGMYKLSNRR